MPGTQKNRVSRIFNIKAPILPVVNMANGGHKKHKKYRITIFLKLKDENKKLNANITLSFYILMAIAAFCYIILGRYFNYNDGALAWFR